MNKQQLERHVQYCVDQANLILSEQGDDCIDDGGESDTIKQLFARIEDQKKQVNYEKCMD